MEQNMRTTTTMITSATIRPIVRAERDPEDPGGRERGRVLGLKTLSFPIAQKTLPLIPLGSSHSNSRVGAGLQESEHPILRDAVIGHSYGSPEFKSQ